MKRFVLPILMFLAAGTVSGNPVDPSSSPPNPPAATAPRSAPPAEEPKLEQRAALHYVAIRTRATVQEMPTVMPRLLPKVFDWLRARKVKPAGPPLIRYRVIDMPKALEIEVGVPVARPLRGQGEIRAGVLPAGRYVILRHTGLDLVAANAALQAWAKQHGIAFQMSSSPRGSVWRGRAEFSLTDPAEEPNRDRWQTEIAYLAAHRKPR